MRVLSTTCALLFALACAAPPPPPQPPPIPADAMAAAEAKWNIFCSTCHGKTGRGDGPAAAALQPDLLRDYSDLAWQKSVTDEYLALAILKGGAAVGKSPLMPPSPDLQDRPEIVRGLVRVVRGFAQ